MGWGRRCLGGSGGALPGGAEDDETGNAIEVARVVGENVMTIGKRCRGDDEVVNAKWRASGHQVCRQARMHAGSLKIKRQMRNGSKHPFDERGAPNPAILGLGAMGADKELGHGDAGDRGRLWWGKPVEVLWLHAPPLNADDHARVDQEGQSVISIIG